MKIAEAFVELFPQLNPQFSTTVTTEVTRAGEKAGKAIIDAMEDAIDKGAPRVAASAAAAGTKAGIAFKQALQREINAAFSGTSGSVNVNAALSNATVQNIQNELSRRTFTIAVGATLKGGTAGQLQRELDHHSFKISATCDLKLSPGAVQDIRRQITNQLGGGNFNVAVTPYFDASTTAPMHAEASRLGRDLGQKIADGIVHGLNFSVTRIIAAARLLGNAAGQAFANGFNGQINAPFPNLPPPPPGGGSAAGRRMGDNFADAFNGQVDGIFLKIAAGLLLLAGSMGPATAAAVNLVAAFAPMAGIVAALPALYASLGIAIGVVKLGFNGLSDAISAGFEGDAKKAAEALAKLTPEAQKTAKAVIALKPEIEKLRIAIADPLNAGLGIEITNLATKYIPLLKSELPGVSTELNKVFKNAAQGAASKEVFNGLKDAIGATKSSLSDLADAPARVLKSIGLLVSGGSGHIGNLGSFIDGLTRKFESFITKAAQGGKIEVWIDNALTLLGQLGGILQNVGSILTSVFSAASGQSAGLLQTIVDVTGQFADFLKTAQGMEGLNALFSASAEIGKALRGALGVVLTEIAKAIGVLAPHVPPLAQAFADLVVAVSPLIVLFAKVTAVLTDDLASILRTLTPTIEKFTNFLARNEELVNFLVQAYILLRVTIVTVRAVMAAWAVVIGILNAVMNANPIALVVIAIAALVAAVILAYKNFSGFRKVVDTVWKAIKVAISAVVDWFVKNAMPLIKKYLELAGDWFMFLWKNVVKPVWEGIKAAFDVWWSFAKPWFAAVGEALKVLGKAFEWLYKNVIKPTWDAIEKVIEAWWDTVSALWKTIISFLQTTFKAAWDKYGALVKAVWDAMRAVIDAWWSVVKAVWGTIISFLATTFKAAWDTYSALVKAVWNAMQVVIETWWNAIKALWTTIITFLATTFKTAWEAYKAVVTAIWNALELLIRTWWTVVSGIFNIIIAFLATTFKLAWDTFKALVTATWNAIQLVIQTVWNFIRDQIFTPIITFLQTVFTAAWQAFQAMVSAVWNAIQLVITTVWTFIRDQIFTPIMNFLAGIFVPAWNAFKDAVINSWNALRDGINAVWGWIRDNIFAPIQNMITNTIPNAFSQGVSAIGAAWDRIKEVAKVPVKFVVDTIINNGIIKGLNWIGDKVGAEHINPVDIGFKTGGILPGYTPGRDVFNFMGPRGMRLALSGGEAIMRPEFTRGVGRGFIDFFNRIARTKGASGVKKAFASNLLGMQGGFADGGVIDWIKRLFPNENTHRPWAEPYFKKAKGDGDGWVSKAWNALTDPSDAFKSGVNSLLGKIPGAAYMRDVGSKAISKLILGKAVDWIKDKIKDIFSMGGTTSSLTPIGGAGAAISSYTGLIAAVRSAFPGTPLWSGYRPGSKTLSGKLSYHAMGRAIDIPPTRAIAQWIVQNYGKTSKEIITPWRDLNWWHGAPHKYNTAVEAQHGVFGSNAHIHWAMRQGGIWPNMPFQKFDTGGYLTEGVLGFSRLNKPERVLTPPATATYDELASGTLIDKFDELIDAVERIAPGVGKVVRGASDDLARKARAK